MSTPRSSMPTLSRRGRVTRDRIVAVAARLTSEHGVAGTSIDQVKAAADVSGSQLYHYFADKQDLVRAVIASQIDAVLDGQEPLLGRLDSLEALRAWRDLLVDLQRRNHCRGGCPIGTLASELAETAPDARQDLLVGFARWEDTIRLGLEAMRTRGELPPDADPAALALALLAAVQGGLALTRLRRDPAPLQTALDTVIDHIAMLRSAQVQSERDASSPVWS